MGIQDRRYYRDDSPYTGFGTSFGQVGRSAVAILIIANVAIYVVDMFTTRTVTTDVGTITESTGWLMSWLQLRGDTLLKPWQWWQLFTYGFAHSPLNSHAGIWHLAFNMLGLFIFGRPVEQHYGKAEFLRFYLSSVVFCGLVWAVWAAVAGHPNHAVLGASGAVMAVTMLFILNFPRQEILLMGIIPMQAWVLGVIFIGVELVRSANPSSPVAWQVHLAGIGFAFLYFRLGWNFQFFNRLKRRPRVRIHRTPEDKLKVEADRLLAKIHQEGESSLTRRERKTLERYSRMMREHRL